jgi:hypothetical protein
MSERVAKAIAEMRASIAAREPSSFALPDNRFHKHARKVQELASRRAIKKLVKPENAAGLIAQIPAPGETLHAILRGDFVLGDALPPLLAAYGPCQHLRISTLALSVKNAETLRELVRTGAASHITLICSHYFRAVDKISVFHAITEILAGFAEIKVSRCHAKILLLANDRGDALVFEGSANLRSSDTIEQLSVFNDPEIHSFHATWMDEIRTLPLRAAEKGTSPHLRKDPRPE